MVKDLFDKQTKMNQNDLQSLFPKNDDLTLGYYEVFVYKDIRYRLHPKVKSWAAGTALRPELHEEMDRIILERDTLCEDRRILEAWFRALCSYCNTPKKAVSHLPECLYQYVEPPVLIYEKSQTEMPSLNTEQIIEIVARRRLTNMILGDE